MFMYCPECKKEIEQIGITGVGTIYKCTNCDKQWVISEYEEH